MSASGLGFCVRVSITCYGALTINPPVLLAGDWAKVHGQPSPQQQQQPTGVVGTVLGEFACLAISSKATDLTTDVSCKGGYCTNIVQVKKQQLLEHVPAAVSNCQYYVVCVTTFVDVAGWFALATIDWIRHMCTCMSA